MIAAALGNRGAFILIIEDLEFLALCVADGASTICSLLNTILVVDSTE